MQRMLDVGTQRQRMAGRGGPAPRQGHAVRHARPWTAAARWRATPLALLLSIGVASAQTNPPPATQPAVGTRAINIQLLPDPTASDERASRTFTARFTPAALQSLITRRFDLLPLPFSLDDERQAYLTALDRIGMEGVVEQMARYLEKAFAGQFSRRRDLIQVPVPAERQAEVRPPAGSTSPYRGPRHETIGFLVHDVTERDYLTIAVRVMNLARQLLESGHPRYDRTHRQYYPLLAAGEVAALEQTHKAAQRAGQEREAVRRRIGAALGLSYDEQTKTFSGTPQWARESRRFTYIVNESGVFIARIKTLVDQHNRELEQAGFALPRRTDRPGIHHDPDLGEVDIVLPAPMMETFLTEVDETERRMADDDVISIEAVRLTDSEIINGAIASRLNAQVRGVHDVVRQGNRPLVREFTLNSLLAVANNRLGIANLRGVATGAIPAGAGALALPSITFPTLGPERTFTNVSSDFSVGADDIFFDGREQSYGFSYIGPDGLEHTLSLDIVDSLREFWDRIERNLIVHKIRKQAVPVEYTVPVGPTGGSVSGIAALIAQRDQVIVVASGTGALSTIEAKAGTWLIIQDFDIAAQPGASTTLSEDERRDVDHRVLMTMYLRDPQTVNLPDPDTVDLPEATAMRLGELRDKEPQAKHAIVQARTSDDLQVLLESLHAVSRDRPIRPGLHVPTYQQVFERRRAIALAHANTEKRERNSKITLSFYSSQGDIISQGVTALGSSNELTSFQTEVRPNVVTPISSFLTKDSSGAKGSSPLTGVAKGEQSSESKNMTHLVIRVRFPTVERERLDSQEGRFVGYFDLPLERHPHSDVDLPFLSSSEHPLKRLSKLRVGLMFAVLQRNRVRKPFELINPNQLQGSVTLAMWETATTRLLMLRKIISDSVHADQALAAEYEQRFEIEVRSLLEYDEDFFNLPNIAMRNTAQWNNRDRILVALNNSTGKFALRRLVDMIDELGEHLVTQEYAVRHLAMSHRSLWGRHRIRPVTDDELATLRRDVASHYLRLNETYGDQFLEAVSFILGLGSYNVRTHKELLESPFRGYRDVVVFDAHEGEIANPDVHRDALDLFTHLRNGGRKGKLGKPSMLCIEDMPPEYRRMVARGREILRRDDWWQFFYPR